MIVDYLSDIFEADSLEEVWSLHTALMAGFGFDRLLYGFTRYKTENSFGALQDALTLSNHSKEYLDKYLGESLYLNGPIVRWLRDNNGAVSWGWIDEQLAKGALSKKEIDVHNVNVKMGLVAGYTIAFKDISNRAKGGIGLCARAGLTQAEVDDIWVKHGKAITVANNAMHLKITQLPFNGQRRPLTPRQKEVLEWVADGKTMQDIAIIMDLTSATVEKHLRLARENLDAETTTQAVMKASTQNQIFVHFSA
ncbi:MAG: helix-turn-helix transcriptional regulator [Brevirhabdus sp.]